MSALLKKGDSGPAVSALQQSLIEAGVPPTGEGDQFGEATEAAVKDYQAKHNLAPDGIVGPKTRASLDGAGTDDAPPPPVDYARMTALMAAAAALADGDLRRGVKEIGATNRGPVVDLMLIGVHRDGGDMLCFRTYAGLTPTCEHCGGKTPTAQCLGAPWCARAVLYWVQTAALGSGYDPTAEEGGDSAGASKWIRWARKTGRLLGEGTLVDEQPRAGDVAVISTPGHGHVMLAVTVDLASGRFGTREGNASNRVNAHWRNIADITAWVRVV